MQDCRSGSYGRQLAYEKAHEEEEQEEPGALQEASSYYGSVTAV